MKILLVPQITEVLLVGENLEIERRVLIELYKKNSHEGAYIYKDGAYFENCKIKLYTSVEQMKGDKFHQIFVIGNEEYITPTITSSLLLCDFPADKRVVVLDN